MEILARMSGVKRRTIENIITEKYERVEFNTVDQLLCKMDCVHLWWVPGPLRDAYYAAELDGPKLPEGWACVNGDDHRGSVRGNGVVYCLDCGSERRKVWGQQAVAA